MKMRRTSNLIIQCFTIGRSLQCTTCILCEFSQNRCIQTLTHSVVRLFFDILHGIDRADVPLVIALEFAIFLGYDGQLEQKSGMETDLFESVIDQLNTTEMTNIENALMWLYVKSWGPKAQHILDDKNLWNFGGEDLEAAIIKTGYPKKKDSTERINALTKLIIGRFEKIDDFFRWSRSIHGEVRFLFYPYDS